MEKDLKQSNSIIQFAGVLKLVDIWPNTGQIPGVPKNPRYILEKGNKDLENSIRDAPEYLSVRPLIVFPYAGAYVVLNGNMRREAAVAVGLKEVPCIVLNADIPPKKLAEYLLKDNISYGKWDYDILANEYELNELDYYGLELPEITPPSDDPEADTPAKDPDAKITLSFRGNLDVFDEVKQKIQKIIAKYPMIDLK